MSADALARVGELEAALARERELRPDGGDEHSTRWYRNPDGPEAADRIEALEAHVRELEALIRELADDMYHRVTNEYEGTLHYPVMRRRYERDMDVVARALAAVDAKGDGNG